MSLVPICILTVTSFVMAFYPQAGYPAVCSFALMVTMMALLSVNCQMYH